MAYEIPIGVEKVQALTKAFGDAAAQVDALDAKVQGLNGTMGRTQTVGGRVVSAPTNPASGVDEPGVTANRARASAPRGPRANLQSVNASIASAVADGADGQTLRDLRDAQIHAQRRVARSDADLFIGPPRAPYEKPVAPRGSATRIASLDPYSREGVRERLDRESSLLDRARQTGDERLIRDQENRVRSAQNAVNRAEKALNGPTQDDILQDILNTSRIGPGGQLYPLVGKLRQLKTADGSMALASALQGAGAAAGADTAALAGKVASTAGAALPLLAGAGIATAAAGAVYGVAEAGAASMRRGNAAFYALGGSPGNVGVALALGGDDAAAKALGFGDRLREGTYGAAFFRSKGIFDMGPTQVDKSGNYVAALDALRGVRDVQQRVRIARDMGLSDDLWTSDLSDSTYRRLRGSRAAAGTESDRRDEAEYRGEKDIASGYWDRFVRAVGTPAAKAVGNEFGALTGDLGSFGRIARSGFNALPGGHVAGDVLDAVQNYFDSRQSSTGNRAKAGGGRAAWRDVDPAIGDAPSATNGTTSGAFPAGARASLMRNDIDRLNSYMGGF